MTIPESGMKGGESSMEQTEILLAIQQQLTMLQDSLILNDTFFAAARDVITVDGMEYSFLKPPYMNFDDHVRTKRKLREAYSQHEFLLLYGYSGCGKTLFSPNSARNLANVCQGLFSGSCTEKSS